MTDAKWKKFENLVAKVQAELAPGHTVLRNQKIKGKISGRMRQIDALIRENIAGHQVLIAIECKDLKQPMDVKSVESVKGLFEDIGAHIKVIVSASGFTKSAINVGENADIKLYRLIDTGEHGWKANIAIPAICHVRNLSSFQFVISYIGQSKIPLEQSCNLYDNERNELGDASDLLVHWWTSDSSENTQPGIHKRVEFTQNPVYLLIDDKLLPIEIHANITIEDLSFFRDWPMTDISGFEDQIGKGIETRGFTLSTFNIDELKRNWILITPDQTPPRKPIITLGIRTCARLKTSEE